MGSVTNYIIVHHWKLLINYRLHSKSTIIRPYYTDTA